MNAAPDNPRPRIWITTGPHPWLRRWASESREERRARYYVEWNAPSEDDRS